MSGSDTKIQDVNNCSPRVLRERLGYLDKSGEGLASNEAVLIVLRLEGIDSTASQAGYWKVTSNSPKGVVNFWEYNDPFVMNERV